MNAVAKKKHVAAKPLNVDRQIRQAKVVLRELRETLEVLEDRRDLTRAKARNGAKPGVPWELVKKDLGFSF
jgi:hypothetical protein